MASQNPNHTSPLRYPGGKGVLANFVKLVISENALLDGHYVEVYAGGASVAWRLLFEEYVQVVHINDINKAVMAFWQSVLYETDALCRLIQDTAVTVDEWKKQRNVQNTLEDHSQLEIAFSTFYLNRTNRSGILQGGIIGGKGQHGEWKIDARYNKSDLVQRIQRIARYSARIRLYSQDAAHFIQAIIPILPQKTLIYLDPPYFHKGQKLYENHYGPQDHAAIAKLVSTIERPWIVSYDGCAEIEALYKQFEMKKYNISYSAQTRYAGSEVIFFSPTTVAPSVSNPATVKLPVLMRPLI